MSTLDAQDKTDILNIVKSVVRPAGEDLFFVGAVGTFSGNVDQENSNDPLLTTFVPGAMVLLADGDGLDFKAAQIISGTVSNDGEHYSITVSPSPEYDPSGPHSVRILPFAAPTPANIFACILDGTLTAADLIKQTRAGAVGLADWTLNEDGTFTIEFKDAAGTSVLVTRTFNRTTGDRT